MESNKPLVLVSQTALRVNVLCSDRTGIGEEAKNQTVKGDSCED